MRNRIARRIGASIAALALTAVAVVAGVTGTATTATADAYGGDVFNSQYSDAHVVYYDRYSGQNERINPGGYAGQDRVVIFRIPSGHHALLYYAGRYITCLEGGQTYEPRGNYGHTIRVSNTRSWCA